MKTIQQLKRARDLLEVSRANLLDKCNRQGWTAKTRDYLRNIEIKLRQYEEQIKSLENAARIFAQSNGKHGR